MVEILKPVEGKEFSIVYSELTERDLKYYRLRDAINFRREHAGQKPGTIVQLKDKRGTVMMSDTAMERDTNWDIAYRAHGDVLIGGLGLGLVLLAAQAKEEVDSITVVEIQQEIIDLVVPQLPLNEKVTVICGDILKWYPPKGVLYDIIYFDIWSAVCGDNYPVMKTLHRRFARRLRRTNPRCWMGSWRRDETERAAKRSYGWWS